MTLLVALVLVQDFELDAERLKEMTAEAVARVEKAVGVPFEKPPVVRLATTAEAAAALEPEILPQMGVLAPGVPEDEARNGAKRMAEMMAQALMGKYAHATDEVMMIAEGMKRLAAAAENPRIHSVDFARVVLIHELVHALDERLFKAASRVPELKTEDELIVWNALLEGHAQYVTRKILAAEDKLALFDEFEKVILADPPGLGEAEKLLIRVLTTWSRFAYIEGRKFFDGLEATGRKNFVLDVFTRPPTDRSVILKPATYYEPVARAKVRDCSPVWDAVGADFSPQDWTRNVRVVDEAILRPSFGDFVEKEKADEVISRLQGGEALIVTPKDAPGSKLVVIALYQMESPQAAKMLHDVNRELMETKDRRMAEGPVRIADAAYQELKVAGAEHGFRTVKTVLFQGQKIPVTAGVVTVGQFVVELTYSNEEIDAAGFLKRVEQIVGLLKAADK